MPKYLIYKTKKGWVAKRSKGKSFGDALPDYDGVEMEFKTKLEADRVADSRNRVEILSSVSSTTETQTVSK